MTDQHIERIRQANPYPDQLPPIPIETVWSRIGVNSTPKTQVCRRPRDLLVAIPRFGVGGIGTLAAALVGLVVAAASFVLLDHQSNNAAPGTATSSTSTVRALVFELGVLRRPETAQAQAFYDKNLRRLPLASRARHAIANLNRVVSLPNHGELLLYVSAMGPGQSGYGLGFQKFYGRGPGGGGGCCVTASALQTPTGPSSGFTSGTTHRTIHQLYYEIVPDGVTRVRWTFPRTPFYPGFGTSPPFAKPLTVTIRVHNNVAAKLLPQRGDATRDTWYSSTGQTVATKHWKR